MYRLTTKHTPTLTLQLNDSPTLLLLQNILLNNSTEMVAITGREFQMLSKGNALWDL